jgi:hypothetical protein
MLGSTAPTAPTRRDLSTRSINEHERMNWRKTSGSIVQVKTHVASEVKIAVKALNRMLELGRPIRVRIA